MYPAKKHRLTSVVWWLGCRLKLSNTRTLNRLNMEQLHMYVKNPNDSNYMIM